MDFGRRAFVTAAGAAGAGALAGCTSLVGGDGSPEPVTATEPNDDGQGTLGELRYLIEHEQSGIAGDSAIPLTRMVHGTGDGFTYVRATYDSEAANLNEFAEEVSVFARSYAIYVDAGGDAVTDFKVDVNSRYDGQPKSFGIRREWARTFNSDEKNAQWYINRIAATFQYPENATTTASNTTTNTSFVGEKL